MSPEYRTPDPWALQHRTEIQVIALGLGIVGALALFKAEYPVNLAGAITALAAIIGYGWIQERWTPYPKDWIQFIYAKAAGTDQATWLLEVEADFDEIWKLPPDSDLVEVLSE